MMAGIIGPGVPLTLSGILALAVFLVFWGIGLHEAEFAPVAA